MSRFDTCGIDQHPFLYYNLHHSRKKTSSKYQNPIFLHLGQRILFLPATTTAAAQMGSSPDPLTNLSLVQSRMDALHKFLSDSVNSSTVLGQPQMNMISSEINSAIRHIIVNGAALLSGSRSFPVHDEMKEEIPDNTDPIKGTILNPKFQIHVDDGFDDFEIVELDAVELLAEHVHFCEICGKGFKRDANLRMHMRAHGNQFKTPEALSNPEKGGVSTSRRMRFSCPYVGCNRNKQHKKFRPLKSVICVKNHFKRSHCPKVYSCNRCNKKSFSVVADLRSHLKHCGECKWRCSCGTSFSRKDKLFGHIVLFEGHMPAIADEDDRENGKSVAVSLVDDDEDDGINGELKDENDLFDGMLFDGFGSTDDYCFQDVLNSPISLNTIGSGIEGFFNF